MSEAPRVLVERSRPLCPFCKGEVGGGHVWVCPGCEAAHHADCHDEHRACATCGPTTAAAPRPPGDERLARARASAERLGFVVVREGTDHLLALNTAYPVFGEPTRAHALLLVSAAQLTRGQVEADLRRLEREPLARCHTTVLYLTELLDPELAAWLRSGHGAVESDEHARVPVALTTTDGVVAPRAFLGSRYPRHEDVARQVAQGAAPRPRAALPRAAPQVTAPAASAATETPHVAPPVARPPAPTTPPAPTDARAIVVAVAAAVGLGALLLALAIVAAG